MGVRTQLQLVDGTPSWTVGKLNPQPVLDHAYDYLRFHMGSGFRITELDNPGPVRSLKEVAHYLPARLADAPLDRVFIVTAQSDGFAVKLRKHDIADALKGPLVIEHMKALIGTPYQFGFEDCSWVVQRGYGEEGVIFPVHNSEAIMNDPQVVQIRPDQLMSGDIVTVHPPEHIMTFLDQDRVIDTEPHDAPAPWGGMLGTGVRIRPSGNNPNPDQQYYCDRHNWGRCGRVVAINGAPT